MFVKYALVVIIGYLLGNFATGIIVSKALAHQDIRAHGSGGSGATNMLRTFGWAFGALTFVGDALKAIAAALIGKAILGDTGAIIGGVAAIVGHNWPALFGFHGGKGIAASFGMMLIADPLIALTLAIIEAAGIALTRTVSIASIVAAISYIFAVWIAHPGDTFRISMAAVVAALALFSHRANISRLIAGTENRLDFRKIKLFSNKKKEG